MVFLQVENDVFSLLSPYKATEEAILLEGFNKPLRSEIELKFLKENRSEKLTFDQDEKIQVVGLINVKESSRNDNKKRKLDNENQEESSKSYVIVGFGSGKLNIYEVNNNKKLELSIELKYEFKKIINDNEKLIVLSDKLIIFDLLELKELSKPTNLKNIKIDTKTSLEIFETYLILINYSQPEIHITQLNLINHKDIKTSKISISVELENKDEEEDDEQPEEIYIEKSIVSPVHNGLIYLKFSNDDYHVYVYSLVSNKLTNRINCQTAIKDFEIFKIKNIEYVINYSKEEFLEFGLFKCIFRKNAINVNVTKTIKYSKVEISLKGFLIFASTFELLAVLNNKELFSSNIETLLNRKEKVIEVDNVVAKKNEEEKIVNNINNLNLTKTSKKSKSKKKKVIITGNVTIDELLKEFKSLQGTPNLIKFLVLHNNNLSLIKTIVKNYSTEEINNLLMTILSSDSVLELNNWIKCFLIFNGNSLIKDPSKKKYSILRNFQGQLKENNAKLNDFLNLQGKLFLLKSQYELRTKDSVVVNQSEEEEEDDDELDDGINIDTTKTQQQLLNSMANSSVNIQTIEEDNIIYENGEIDENNNDDEEVEDDDEEEVDDENSDEE